MSMQHSQREVEVPRKMLGKKKLQRRLIAGLCAYCQLFV
jgi:hypothetical protein